jgi:4-hydroxy-tetrahydrodipicolinate synthase
VTSYQDPLSGCLRLLAARAEQKRLTGLFTIIEVPDTTRIGPISAALGAFKAALKLRGVIAHAGTVPPLLPLLPAEMDKIAAVIADAGIPRAGGK